MMGFGGLLNDDEAAAVLSYVRLSFGNNGKLVSPATVKKVREATKDRANFYMADELLKEHPLKAARSGQGEEEVSARRSRGRGHVGKVTRLVDTGS